MIIERIDVLPLRVPFARKAGQPLPAAPSDALHMVWCRVTTRDGVSGYGECLGYRPPFQAGLVATLRDAIVPLVVDRTVTERARLNLEIRRRYASFGRSGLMLNALAAVDLALWDIAGKMEGQSLATMLGGARHRTIPVMASLDKYNDGPNLQRRLEQALAADVAAVKVHESDLGVIEAGRQAIGSAPPYVADLNNALTWSELQAELRRWQALDLLWLEDPIWPPEALLEREVPGITVGLGAELGTIEQLALYARAPSIGVVQPDLCMMGGISEGLKALSDIAPADASLAPHTPFIGPAALASLQMIAAVEAPGHFATIEAEAGQDPYGLGLVQWQKSVTVPDGPGLGADPDPRFLQRYAA